MYRCKLCGDVFEKKTPSDKTQKQLMEMMNKKGHLCYSMLFKEKNNIDQNRGLKKMEKIKKTGYFCVDCGKQQYDSEPCIECGCDVWDER